MVNIEERKEEERKEEERKRKGKKRKGKKRKGKKRKGKGKEINTRILPHNIYHSFKSSRLACFRLLGCCI